jgi:hypothetical protein
MAAGVLVESCPIGQKGIRGPAIGDESLKNVTEDFFNGKIDSPIWRKCQAVFTFKANDSFHHTRRFPSSKALKEMMENPSPAFSSSLEGLTLPICLSHPLCFAQSFSTVFLRNSLFILWGLLEWIALKTIGNFSQSL